MAIGNVELMHECFPKHSRMGLNEIRQSEEKREKRGVSIESKAGRPKI